LRGTSLSPSLRSALSRPLAAELPEALDFDLTDFDTVRTGHGRPPVGFKRLPELTPGYWEPHRRKPQPTDRALAGATIDWLLTLPPRSRGPTRELDVHALHIGMSLPPGSETGARFRGTYSHHGACAEVRMRFRISLQQCSK
jgi:hypothetical protein